MPLGGETEVRAPQAEESQELGQVSGVEPGLSHARVYPRKELSSSRTLIPGTSSLGEHLALAFPSFSGRRLRGRNFWSGGCRRGLPEVDPEFCGSGRKGVGNRIVFCQNGLLKTLAGGARSPKAPACRRITSTESWSGALGCETRGAGCRDAPPAREGPGLGVPGAAATSRVGKRLG